jgi:hypothetical protein
MASWRPMMREPDAIRATIYDYLRHRAPLVYLEGGASARPLGRADLIMSNGRTLAVDLTITPIDVQTIGSRSALVFEVQGNAAEASAGYEIRGKIVLDRETLAFLLIEANPTIVNARR